MTSGLQINDSIINLPSNELIQAAQRLFQNFLGLPLYLANDIFQTLFFDKTLADFFYLVFGVLFTDLLLHVKVVHVCLHFIKKLY